MLIVIRIEQGKLPMAVDDIHGIVNVERHRLWRSGVTGAIQIDRHPHQADEVAQRSAFSQRETVGCERRSV
jgi:hypothetical protein